MKRKKKEFQLNIIKETNKFEMQRISVKEKLS